MLEGVFGCGKSCRFGYNPCEGPIVYRLGHKLLPPEADPPALQRRVLLRRRGQVKMYSLYILKSNVREWHYIGIAEDVKARVSKHNGGSVRSTKAYRPLQVVHVETFRDKTSARKRELFLKKTARARKELFEQFR